MLCCEQRTALANKAAGNATPATCETKRGKVSNGTSALVSVVVVSEGEAAPVAVKFEDTKSNESAMANLLFGPLESVIAQNSVFVEDFPREEDIPNIPGDNTATNMVQ